ncbi:hypothetical protein X777_02814 [Ooceraea biroi]|uniref:Uncharacterized protein n=1 Tax=Ooceraea biroi TaxID=2015173 RepID=A0A026X2A1_OOCBI|nr:hypothetical protein X777_02814 [Ooceraea biroi]
MSLTNEIKIVVVAACVLHNICIRYNDETEVSDSDHEHEDEDQDEGNVILEAAIIQLLRCNIFRNVVL